MRFPTNAEQYVHFRSFIFHLSGCCRIMNGEGGARVVAVSAGPARGPFSRKRLISPVIQTSGKIRMLFFLCVFAAEVPVRTHGRGQRERSLIRSDGSSTRAFPG